MSDFVDLPVKDRMKTFLFNEDMADVNFLVGTEDVQVSSRVVTPTMSTYYHNRSVFPPTRSYWQLRRKCSTDSCTAALTCRSQSKSSTRRRKPSKACSGKSVVLKRSVQEGFMT